jgi:hypothetical protein
MSGISIEPVCAQFTETNRAGPLPVSGHAIDNARTENTLVSVVEVAWGHSRRISAVGVPAASSRSIDIKPRGF